MKRQKPGAEDNSRWQKLPGQRVSGQVESGQTIPEPARGVPARPSLYRAYREPKPGPGHSLPNMAAQDPLPAKTNQPRRKAPFLFKQGGRREQSETDAPPAGGYGGGRIAAKKAKSSRRDKGNPTADRITIRQFFGWEEKKKGSPPQPVSGTGTAGPAHTGQAGAFRSKAVPFEKRERSWPNTPRRRGKDSRHDTLVFAPMPITEKLRLDTKTVWSASDDGSPRHPTGIMAAEVVPSAILPPPDKAQKRGERRRASRRRARSLFLASFLVTTIVFLAFCAMYMADMNTKNTGGIMEEETVFAFAASEQALDLTVLNERVRLDISWLTSAYGAVADYVGLCWQCAKGSIQILADKGEQFIQLAAPYVQAAGQTLERLLLALVGIGRV